MTTELPKGWGEDPLSAFIKGARHNCIATFVNYRELPVLKALREVDAIFRSVLSLPFKDAEEATLPGFVGRSHCAYLGSVQLSAGGQVAETYPLIRLCLENALYALYIQGDPTAGKDIPERLGIWVNRDTDAAATKKCRNTFTAGNVRNHLSECDPALGKEASTLYEQAIVYGAHPNFYAHATTSDPFTPEGGTVHYLLPNTTACKLAIQTAVRAGMCSLKVFGLALKDRFEKAGIPSRLQAIGAFSKSPGAK